MHAAFVRLSYQQLANYSPSLPQPDNDFEIRRVHNSLANSKRGHSMIGKAVLENVRRYRTIASLYRQAAAFRPAQRSTLLAQAYEYERLAITELEAHFIPHSTASRWEMAPAA
jgi:hypothetical protein